MEILPKIFKNNYLEDILNAITDGILLSDHLGNVLWVNKGCENLSQTKSADMVGKHMDELEAERVFLPSVTKLVIEKQTNVSTVQSAGDSHKVMVSGYPIKDDAGNIKIIIAHARDITGIVHNTQEHEELLSLLKRYSQEIVKNNFDKYEDTGKAHYTGESKAYLNLLATVDRISATDSTVLITGETGVGKNVMARRIHHLSERRNQPFIEVNCGAIPGSLIESELFGYAKGAFTGANATGKAGLIKLADKGTLFLDEIGELPLHLQAKFLQFLQDGLFRPISAEQSHYADVRVIAATNANLAEEVEHERFRSDLFYRLNVLPVHVPALRDRREDIFGIIDFNMEKYNTKYKRKCRISPEAANLLEQYDWPGNVRELENLIERLVVIAPEKLITVADLPSHIRTQEKLDVSYTTDDIYGQSLTETLNQIEKNIIIDAYSKYKTTRDTAAQLGITQSLLMRRLKKYHISKKQLQGRGEE